MTIQNPKTLEWNPAVVLNKVHGVPRSYIVATPSGKELRRNRSQIRQIPQVSPKQVKFDLRRNRVHRFDPGIDHTFPKTQPSQPIPKSNPTLGTAQSQRAVQTDSQPSGAAQFQRTTQTAGPPPGTARAVSATPGAGQPVNSAPAAEGHYVTRSGRVVKAPSRMDN